MGGYFKGYLLPIDYKTNSVPANTYTTLASASLSAGHTYIATASYEYSTNNPGSMMIGRLYDTSGIQAIERADMNAGGGVCLSALIQPTENTTLNFGAYQNTSGTKTAGNIKFNVYLLD